VSENSVPDIDDQSKPKRLVSLFLVLAIPVVAFYFFSKSVTTPPDRGAMADLPVQRVADGEGEDVIGELPGAPETGGFTLPLVVAANDDPVDSALAEVDVTAIPTFSLDFDPVSDSKSDSDAEEAYMERLAAPKAVSFARVSSQSGDLELLDDAVLENLVGVLGSESGGNAPTEGSFFGSRKTGPLEATFLEQMDFTLIESTIIPVTIDQALNTELPGRVRGVVSDDVWSADGARILVPRGALAMGEYTSSQQDGQSRIFVIWNRLLDPFGLDVPINSGATDQAGMAGLDGTVNTRFFRRFGSAALISIIGGYAQGESKNDNQRESLANDFNTASTVALESSINIAPVITRQRGSIAAIYVNQDINFYKAYMLGLAQREKRETAKQANLAARKVALQAGRPLSDGGRPRPLSKFAHPIPFSLGKLPLSVGAARLVSDRQLETGFKSAIAVARLLKKIKIDDTTRPNRCADTFLVTEGRLLSVLVQEFLLGCGYAFDSWLPEKNGLVMDWKFVESGQISMPEAMRSLASLLAHYSIKLILDENAKNRYVVLPFEKTSFQLQQK
jgi:hypothetical protein